MRYHGAVRGRIGPIAAAGLAAAALGGLAPVAAAQGQRPTTTRPPTTVRSTAPPGSQAQARPSEGLRFADGLLRSRQYDLAAEEYERFLRAARDGQAVAADREIADAWFGLGNARRLLQKYKEARQAFEGFLQAAPDHPNAPMARFRVGESAYVLSDLPAARRSLEAFVAGAGADPAYLPAAWTFLGDIGTRLGDLQAARRGYEQALAVATKGQWADRSRFGLGRILNAQGEPAPALAVLRELAATGGPEWVDRAWLQVGQVEASAGRWAEAVAAFEELEKVSPRSQLLAEERLDRGEALVKLARRAEAEALLRPLAADPQSPLAVAAGDALGVVLLADGRPADALVVLDATLARPNVAGPAASAARSHAAQAALAAGDAAGARARLAAILRDDPKGPYAADAQLRAAALALEAKDLDEARRLAGAFAAAFPTSPEVAFAHKVEAQAALAQGKPREAIEILTASLANDKPRPEVAQAESYYLGLAYQQDGQGDKAAEVLDKLATDSGASPGAAADAQYLIGQADFEAKRYEPAIAALEKYLAGKPNGSVAADALARVALAHAALGHAEQAEEALAKLAAAAPASPALAPTRLRVAEAALQAKQFDRAAELFRVAAEAKPADPALAARAWSGLGWSLLGVGRPAEAAAALGSAIEAAPDDPIAADARFARARALEDAKQPDAAGPAYAEAIAKHPESSQAAPARLSLARLQAAAGKPADAAKTYADLVQKSADGAGIPVDALLAEWGWALVDAGQAAEADAAFGRLLKDHPDSPHAADARLNLAESAYAAKDLDRALDLLRPVVAPGSVARPELVAPALYRTGRAEVDRRAWPAAITAFDRLLADFPDSPLRRQARFWRAEATLQSGDAKAAAAEFTALGAEPPAADEPRGIADSSRGRLAQALAQQGRWDEALAAADAWEKAVTDPVSDPIGPEVSFARGRALLGLARFDDARAAFDRVIAARPGSTLAAEAQWMRGESYFHQAKEAKDYREALREFYRVVFQYDAPQWQAAALFEAGKVHEKLDQWAKAAEAYEQLIKRFPEDRTAADAGRRLEAARKRTP